MRMESLRMFNLFFFLTQVVRSKVNHALIREFREIALEEASEGEIDDSLSFNLLTKPEPPDSQIRYKELADQIRSNAAKHRQISKNELLTTIIDIYIKCPDTQPADLAEQLNISEEEIKRAKRRLKRVSNKLLEGWIK